MPGELRSCRVARQLRRLAQEIIVTQQQEIAVMRLIAARLPAGGQVPERGQSHRAASPTAVPISTLSLGAAGLSLTKSSGTTRWTKVQCSAPASHRNDLPMVRWREC